MRFLPTCAVVVGLALPVALPAQTPTEERDVGYIQGMIEDNLSGEGHQVIIEGFEGALSSRATIDLLTIADDEGIWLRAEGLVFEWTRSALLTGRIDVSEMSAVSIEFLRQPQTPASAPNPEATPFSFALPELPVAINIERIEAGRIVLGAPLLGSEYAFSVDGAVALDGGEGTLNIIAERLDATVGTFEITGAYSNTTEILALALDLQEAPNGIIANLLDLPTEPSVALRLSGEAPISDYEAELSIATNGIERITGDFGFLSPEAGQQEMRLDVRGDVTALVETENADFFGSEVHLAIQGTRGEGGALDLSQLQIEAQSLALQGSARIGADGWPQVLNLSGVIAAADGSPVLLPFGEADTYVGKADIDITYDTANGNGWTGQFEITDYQRPDLTIPHMILRGGGEISPQNEAAPAIVDGNLIYSLSGLTFADAGLSDAIGTDASGILQFERRGDEPFRINALTLTGPGVEIAAQAEFAIDNGVEIKTDFTLSAQDMARFSRLTGLDLRGSADLEIGATIRPLDGMFDVTLNGETLDLGLGVAQVDPLLAGSGMLHIIAMRDTSGTRIEQFEITTPEVNATGSANLTNTGGQAVFDMDIQDVGLSIPDLDGPATLRGTLDVAQEQATTNINAVGPGGAAFSVSALTDMSQDSYPTRGTIQAEIADLAPYAALVGQPISGAITAEVTGEISAPANMRISPFNAEIKADGMDLAFGNRSLSGAVSIRADARRDDTGELTLHTTAQAPGDATITADIQLPDQSSAEIIAHAVVNDLRPYSSIAGVALAGSADINMTGTRTTQFDITQLSANIVGNDLRAANMALAGEVAIAGTVNLGQGGRINAALNGTGPGGAEIEFTTEGVEQLQTQLHLRVDDVSHYSGLIGRSLTGGIGAEVFGTIAADLAHFDLGVEAETRGLGLGIPALGPLLNGVGTLKGRVQREADGSLGVEDLVLRYPNFSGSGNLSGRDGGGAGNFDLRLNDVGLFTDDLSGPATAIGTAQLMADGGYALDITATGPGGIAAQIDGNIAASGQLNLSIRGNAPLGLANGFIEPRRVSGTADFNLALNGPPSLSALFGTINIANGRLAAPSFGQALENIAGQVALNGENARININGTLEDGGQISVLGPVGLAGSRVADLQITARNLVLRDPTLFETTADATLRFAGPLDGGAVISGRVDIGPTEIKIPSSSTSPLGPLPQVTHISPPSQVRQTLRRAGLSIAGVEFASASGRSGPIFGLDITINAPARIFVRGRGLDAELGGTLRIGGTTDLVVPSGSFELIRGRIDILQQRFSLDEGGAFIQGDFIPYIRLVASTESRDGTQVQIVVEGPATEPKVTFESSPDLPQDEVLSRLIFGRDIASISPLQAVQLAAAVSTLAGGSSGGLIDRIRQGTGLDDFDITTDEDGNAAVRAGAYLSDNVYTDVTVGTENTEINLNLDLTDDVTITGSTGTNGDTSVGIFFERDY